MPQFFKRHAVFFFFCIAGCFAGIWGFAAGCAAGVVFECIVGSFIEERMLCTILESGRKQKAADRPFPGALYLCALSVFCTGSAEVSASYLENVFSRYRFRDWHTYCTAAASVKEPQADVWTECLASSARKAQQEIPSVKLFFEDIFHVLEESESAWDEKKGNRPSTYLAELLEYTYISRDLTAAYHTLGLEPGVPLEQVKSAHRKLAAGCHPDSSGITASARFMEIQSAYELIVRQLY